MSEQPRPLRTLREDLEEVTANAFEPLLQFFAFWHLPEHLQIVSKPFASLAIVLVSSLPANLERSEALRKLLEAKDCAVRAVLYK